MYEIIKQAKTNIILTIGAAIAIVIVTGQLGLGAFLNNRFAFGYGGGLGYIVTPLTAVNTPLVIPAIIPKGGRLYNKFNSALAELEVPPGSVGEYAIFDIKELTINSNNNVCLGTGQIIGNIAFTVFAKDINDQPINVFDKDINVSITMAGLPVNSSNLGVYYLNSNNQWVFGGQAIFNIQNSKVTFTINESGTFAIINTPGLPRLLEAGARCSGQVLGVKEFANGSILRTCDAQMYVIENSIAKSIGRLDLTNQTYQGQVVNDVDYDVIVRYTPAGAGPSRDKNFSEGELLRTCDYKIYRVEGEDFRHITTHKELQSYFEGQKINNVDYWQIAKYRNINYNPVIDQQVLGIKKYAPGALIRTIDNKVYIIEASTVKHLVTLDKTISFFAGQPIFDISYDELETYRNPTTSSDGQRVLGVKRYGDGAILRTRDWSVYRVENGQIRKVALLPSSNQTTFQGQKINDVDYGVLSLFTKVEDGPVVNPTQQVLGVKQYANGTLLRTPDSKVYVIRDGKPQHIATLAELNSYSGVSIINIFIDELNQLILGPEQVTTGGQVLGVKKYGDGTLLKTPDWKLYEVMSGAVHHIATVPGPQDYYQGRKIINISLNELAQYESR